MTPLAVVLLVVLATPLLTAAFAVSPTKKSAGKFTSPIILNEAQASSTSSSNDPDDPQVWASGYSPKNDLLEAIQEATELAMKGLPKGGEKIDVAIIAVSSLYDGGTTGPSMIVPAVLSSAATYGSGIQHLVGCSAAGIVSSSRNEDYGTAASLESGNPLATAACKGIESESMLGVSVVLGILPDVELKTFHVQPDDVPDDFGRVAPRTWKRAVGLNGFMDNEQEDESTPPAFFLLPAPSYQKELDDLLQGLSFYFPQSNSFGGIASTVSSLSRARLFRYDANDSQSSTTVGEGCIGIAMKGDIAVTTMFAQGTKPVGGIYRVVKGQDSTIQAIVLDERATQELKEAEGFEDPTDDTDDEDEEVDQTASAIAAAAYAKAAIPKPPLAEANFIMRTLSDDDQSFMRKAILVGLERSSLGRTPNELARLAEGKGHRFQVYQVASAGMKDGSVTLPLGSVNVESGTRVRFFVRESDFSKKEIKALWTGYKKKTLAESLLRSSGDNASEKAFEPALCMLMPTLDRGVRLFGGKQGFESNIVNQFLPSLPCVGGFFSNGVLGKLDEVGVLEQPNVMVHGSASSYVLIGSNSGRPLFNAARAAEEEAQAARDDGNANDESASAAEAGSRSVTPIQNDKAPRAENGELILKRREVHSGRALTVSTVEWSVAEKQAVASSTLEGFMWDKETEVDRYRERVPLANLLSQCRLSMSDPSMPRPRDWISPIKEASKSGFVVIPEAKRAEPATGSLRRRYDVAKLVKGFVKSGVPAFVVNCDGVLFGGSIDDLTTAREASSQAALETGGEDGIVVPPVLASNLILYPYQLYEMRLAGADAVNLVAGALASKDLLYLTKIASSVQLQVAVSVTSEAQIDLLLSLSKGSVQALVVSNRQLEDFSFDLSGQQALDLLNSESLVAFREQHGDDTPVLVEGRVGIIERTDAGGDKSFSNYLKELQENGAVGALVGGALASETAQGESIAKVLFTSS